jgi:hypothetical protein
MLSYVLAFVAVFLGDLVGGVLTLPVHSVDKRLHWAGKSLEQWQSVGVETPGETLRAVSLALPRNLKIC